MMLFHNCYRLGLGLTALVTFVLVLPAAFGQVVTLPTLKGGWGAQASALGPNDIFVVGAADAGLTDYVASSLAFSGSINTGFGGGIVENSVSTYASDWPVACAVDYEGRLLSAGLGAAKTGGVFLVARYNNNGSLDTTFGSKGIATTQFKGSSEAAAYAMTLQYSGGNEKIVVAGNNGELNPVSLARYTQTGALDTTFGSGGTVSTTTPFAYPTVEDVALQSNGDIIVCAVVEESNGVQAMALMRYTANGKLDTTFGANGYVSLAVGGQDTFPYGIAVDADNNIVVAASNEDTGEMALVRFTANGGLDGTFGSGGVVTGSFASSANAVAIDGDGNIVIAGVAANYENLVVARFLPTGALDTTFGSSGGVFNGQGYADDFAYGYAVPAHSVQLQPSSSDPMGYKILAVGGNDVNGAKHANVVVRYNSNGTPDTTF